MVRRHLVLPLLICLMAWLAACDEGPFTEPTPIPPPPTNSGALTAPTATIASEEVTETVETAAVPTSTLVPTTTALPPVVTIPPDPNVRVLSSLPLPTTSRDLLFLADGAFKQWRQATGQIETLVAGPDPASRSQEDANLPQQFVGDITDFAMSADGKRAVVARLLATETITRTVPETNEPVSSLEAAHELLFIDMISREIWTLVPQVDNLAGFQLSPDAQQLAFVASGLDGLPDSTPENEIPSHFYVMATGGGNPGSVRQIYSCQPLCFAPQWHVESNLVVFADSTALWLYNIAASAPEQLVANVGFSPEISVLSQISVYSPIAWANNGRSLLLWHAGWEGGSRAVLDVPTGALLEVPNSFTYADPFPTQVNWMPDGRLFVLRSVLEANNTASFIELWRFDVAAGRFILEESAQLSNQPVGALGATYLENGRFAFALNTIPGSDPSPASGTYWLTSVNETPVKVNNVPSAGALVADISLLWARDGSGALLLREFQPQQNTVYYAPANDEWVYDVTAVLGENPHRFQWQPEIIVP